MIVVLCHRWRTGVLARLANPVGTAALGCVVEPLMDFLTALGQDVEITVRPTRKEHGEVYVVP